MIHSIFFLIFLFPELCFCQYNRTFISSVFPLSNESFGAILYHQYDKYESKSLIIIDSNGQNQLIREIDTSLTPSPIYNLNRKSTRVLNDSCLIYESINDTSINFINFKSGLHKKLLQRFRIGGYTNDGNYMVVWPIDRLNKERRIYHIENGEMTLVAATTEHNVSMYPFGRDKFLMYNAMRNNHTCYDVFNSDFTLFDISTPEHPFLNFNEPKPGFKEDDVVFQYSRPTNTEIVWNYNLSNKLLYVLFNTMHITHVFPFPIENLYLVKGLNDDEYKTTPGKPESKYADYIPPPEGYWIIGNSKTQQFKKVGYEDFEPTISSSGRHILFYKHDGDDYELKVLSVKDLIEGM